MKRKDSPMLGRASIYLLLLFNFCAIAAQTPRLKNSADQSRNEELSVRLAKANEMQQFMNLSVNPCEDFYSFACGNWPQYSKVTEEESCSNVGKQLEQRIDKSLEDLLNESNPQPTAALVDVHKIREFYKSCLVEQRSSNTQQTYIKNFLKRHGNLPAFEGPNWQTRGNYNWLHTVAELRATYGFNILISLEMRKQPNGIRSLFLLEPSTTIIPAEFCSSLAFEQAASLRDDVYEAIQNQIAHNMRTWFSLPHSEANRFAGDIISFEFKLCEHMRKEHSMDSLLSLESPRDEPNKFASSGYGTRGQNRLNGGHRSHADGSRSHGPVTLSLLSQRYQLDLKGYVEHVFRTTHEQNVYLESEDYFENLAKLVNRTSKFTLANYILYNALVELNFPSNDNSATRLSFCMRQVKRFFPQTLSELYHRRFNRNQFKDDIKKIFMELVEVFKKSLNAKWLDRMRGAAQQKLAQFKLDFPSTYAILNKLELDQPNYWQKLDAVLRYKTYEDLMSETPTNSPIEAYDASMQLDAEEYKILIGLGNLLPPLYHFNYPTCVKLATIGQRMLRELAGAFDEFGWHKNPQSQSAWNDYTRMGFRNLSKCFQTQYSNYRYNNPNTFRNASRLREIINDSVAVNVAFETYLKWLENRSEQDRYTLTRETLTDVNFTNTQLFFIQFAQSHCVAKYSEMTQPVPDFLPLVQRSDEKYMVNGPLMNSEEFSREFGCAIGSDMNPDEKCVIY